MKFQYAFRDKENERHDGIVVASSKDDAFKKLRAKGVKPFFVAPAPGLLNGILGLGKRGVAIVLLCIVCLALCALVIRTRRDAEVTRRNEDVFSSTVRRQPIGDVAVIDEGIRTGWASVFDLEGERFLASFAIPGIPAGQRNTTEDEIRKALDHDCRTDSSATLGSDSLEARQIRAMVEGMKNELREYLAAGGTIALYGQQLVMRQEEEIGYYQKAQHYIDEMVRQGKSSAELKKAISDYNTRFRSMGIKPLTMPEKSRK